jgi:hypothetical protein
LNGLRLKHILQSIGHDIARCTSAKWVEMKSSRAAILTGFAQNCRVSDS